MWSDVEPTLKLKKNVGSWNQNESACSWRTLFLYCVCVCIYQPRVRGHADHTLPLGRNTGPGTGHLHDLAGVQQTVAVRVADCGGRGESSDRVVMRAASQPADGPPADRWPRCRSEQLFRTSRLQRDQKKKKKKSVRGAQVPLRWTPLVFQSLVIRWAGWEVRTTRCCMSLQVRFLLEPE